MAAEAANQPQLDEFDEIEQAVLATPRGQWFLREYARRNRNTDTELVLNAINRLSAPGGGEQGSQYIELLRRELQDMSSSIQQTRSEIAAIKPDDGNDNRIMAATEELDAIVTATERATSDILSAAERLQEIAEEIRGGGAVEKLCDEIDNHVTDMFTACSFQDLTGQRTTKVVQVLRYLEQRVNAMIAIWGIEEAATTAPKFEEMDKRPDAHLLNGPQLEGEGVSQDDVDSMLNGTPADSPSIGEDDIEAILSAGEDKPAEEAGDKEVDLDDIDAIMSAAEPAEPEVPEIEKASMDADDIDALFDEPEKST